MKSMLFTLLNHKKRKRKSPRRSNKRIQKIRKRRLRTLSLKAKTNRIVMHWQIPKTKKLIRLINQQYGSNK